MPVQGGASLVSAFALAIFYLFYQISVSCQRFILVAKNLLLHFRSEQSLSLSFLRDILSYCSFSTSVLKSSLSILDSRPL